MKLFNKIDKKLFLRGITEVIGTMILVFVGCGTIVLTTEVQIQEERILVNGLAFGLTYICLYYSLRNISGAHLNPAISFAYYLQKKMTLKEMIVYMVSQFLGSAIGAGFLELLFYDANLNFNTLGATMINQGMINYDTLGIFIAFFMETFFSFIFVLIVLLVQDFNKHKSVDGIVIGLAYAVVQFLGFSITGASINPARSFGPAMFAMINGQYLPAEQLWLYLVAPLVGALIACIIGSIIKLGYKENNNSCDE